MLGLVEAGHPEYGQECTPVITAATCEVPEPGAPRLKGKQKVILRAGSLAAQIYGRTEALEEFACSFELNPEYQPLFERSDLRVSGVGEHGEARVVELAGAGFYLGTLYLPQSAALEGESHPLIEAFVRAVNAASSSHGSLSSEGQSPTSF